MIYIPLRYTASAKYPIAWFFDQLVFVDMLMAIAATSYTANTLFEHCICIPLYVLSLMCIYEIGYFDNDMNAAKSETSPVLSSQVHRFADYRLEPYSWICSALLAGMGSFFAARLPIIATDGIWVRTCAWFVVLIAIRIVFHAYNRQKEKNRTSLYFVLQVLKYCGVLVIFPPSVFGVVIIAAQIMAISVVYLVYRLADRKTSELIDRERMRLAFAFGVGVPLLLAGARTDLDSAMAAVLAVAWLLLRLAKTKVMSIIRSRKLLS